MKTHDQHQYTEQSWHTFETACTYIHFNSAGTHSKLLTYTDNPPIPALFPASSENTLYRIPVFDIRAQVDLLLYTQKLAYCEFRKLIERIVYALDDVLSVYIPYTYLRFGEHWHKYKFKLKYHRNTHVSSSAHLSSPP